MPPQKKRRRRRKTGRGWLERNASDTYVIRFRDPSIECGVGTYNTKKQTRGAAEEALDQWRKNDNAVRDGYLDPKELVEIESARIQWLDAKEDELQPRSRQKYRQVSELFLTYCESKGYTYLEDLPLTLRSDYMKWLKKRFKPNTVNSYFDATKTFIIYCVGQDLLDKNPIVKGRRVGGIGGKPDHFDEEDLALLKPVLKKDPRFKGWFSDYFYSYLYTGARLRELYVILPSDVNMRDNTIDLLNSKFAHRVTKRSEQYRTLAIHRKLLPIIKKRMNKNEEPLFPAIKGGGKYNGMLRDLCLEAGVRPRSSHAAGRHSFSYFFLRSGGTLLQLKEALGHRDISITEMYAHLAPRDTEKAILSMKI